jgi:hypothetical protein
MTDEVASTASASTEPLSSISVVTYDSLVDKFYEKILEKK